MQINMSTDLKGLNTEQSAAVLSAVYEFQRLLDGLTPEQAIPEEAMLQIIEGMDEETNNAAFRLFHQAVQERHVALKLKSLVDIKENSK